MARTTGGSKPSDSRPAGCPLTDDDVELFRNGEHRRLYDKLGARRVEVDGVDGVVFTLWAPAARRIAVFGDFNDWNTERHLLQPLGQSGVWSLFVPGVANGALYKFKVASRFHDYTADKADPFAFAAELPPGTASRVCDLEYGWRDDAWMRQRRDWRAADSPMSTYELHLGSWRRKDDGSQPGYRELAAELVPYLVDLGFSHVEFLPPMEHPFYGSWGYQTTGYFAATSRFGSPQDLMYLIDELHRAGIGVLFDWVPSHFPRDEHGLAFFDGTHLFEHADPRLGFHPDWTSHIFNYGRNQVRSFLVSSALFWLDRYHVDGIRVDAVASMLMRDYSRDDGQWVPNKYGGKENLEAIDFLRQLNDAVHEEHPGVTMIAEESTAWPMVSRPGYVGGLGFDMKWDMGWMHDTLEYAALDPVFRKYHHDKLTFRMVYAYSENFVLALSHDEVVHGKSSLVGKMSGDHWMKFASLRALYGYMFGQPGKKLLFMGSELAPWREWDHESELEWELLRYPQHAGVQRWVRDLNHLYRETRALHELDFEPDGFRWIDCSDHEQSVLCFTRQDAGAVQTVLVVCNFTPVPRHGYRIGVPLAGTWRELLNSDAESYGGSGQGNLGASVTVPMPSHGQLQSLSLTLPPLAVVFFEHVESEAPAPGAEEEDESRGDLPEDEAENDVTA